MPDSKNNTVLNAEQHNLIENAQQRIRQKKWLFRHIILFLIGAVFFFVLNKLFHYGPDYDWYVLVLLSWGFLLVYHIINVTILNRLLSPKWERHQREKLLKIQQERIALMESEISSDQTDKNAT